VPFSDETGKLPMRLEEVALLATEMARDDKQYAHTGSNGGVEAPFSPFTNADIWPFCDECLVSPAWRGEASGTTMFA